MAGEVRSLTRRLYGLEIMVGPYAVAHYRLARALRSIGAEPDKQRLNIYLADTLAPVGDEKKVDNPLGFMGKPIVEERIRADEVKRDKPILAILGNPPYRRLREGETYGLVGRWVADQLWEKYKAPVRQAGWGGELNTFPDLYVAFFAWSQWKLFWQDDAPRRGVLCFISNRSYLTGKPFAGLRQWLRREFDRIDILDLRGDSRGARPAGIEVDENLFDIEVGVAIIVAWATGKKPQDSNAAIRYADAWAHGAFTRDEKNDLLKKATKSQVDVLNFVFVERSPLDPFRPHPFEGRGWPSIRDLFHAHTSGFRTKRDDFVYDASKRILTERLTAFYKLSVDEAKERFHETRDRKVGNALKTTIDPNRIELCAYRPFDRRWCYRHSEFIDFIRPNIDEYWRDSQVTIYTMHKKVGAGPAVLVHALKPDYHAFRGSYGSYGGYAFPMNDRRSGGDGYNLDLRLVGALSKAYGGKLAPEEIFDVIVALLSAPSYTRRFAADLEDSFPHVPFPADFDVFLEAAEAGARIRRLQTFDLQPEQRFWTARLEGSPVDRALAVAKIGSAFVDQGNEFGTVRLNQALRLERVPLHVWEFAISGYRVVYRWLDARNGLSFDEVIDDESGETVQRQVLDLVARVAAYIDACDAAEPILEAALASPLTKGDLKYTQSALL